MGKFILTMQMSLNGIVSDVEQWMSLSDEILEDTLDYYESLDAVLFGGNTYPFLAEYWQNAEKASDSALERTFARKINDIRKIVITRTEIDLAWRNSEQIVISDDQTYIREMERLKQSTGRHISVESGLRTWHQFIRHSLFDEMWLLVHPVIVPQGDHLFATAAAQVSLHLTNSKTYRNGVVGLHYQRS